MGITEALRIVIELASQNIVDATDMPEEAADQTQAIELVQSTYLSEM